MSTETAVEPGKSPQQVSPVAQLPKSVFKDEGKDTSAAAVERNELGNLNRISETQPQQAAPTEPPAPTPTDNPPPAPQTIPEQKTDEPKLLAGKYKTVEELEKGYVESQKGFQQRVQQEAEKQAATLADKKAQEIIAEKFKSLLGDQQTVQAAQQVVQKSLGQMSPEEHIDLFTRDPAAYNRMQQQETLNAIRAAQVQDAWRRENEDLLKMEVVPGEQPMTGEALISAVVLTLAKQHPEKLNDGTGETLLREATGHVRNLLQMQRNQGKQEAMIVRETVAPLQATTGGTAQPENQPQAAPAKPVDPVEDAVQQQRANLKRISLGREQVRY